jgi:hypothetical protein
MPRKDRNSKLHELRERVEGGSEAPAGGKRLTPAQLREELLRKQAEDSEKRTAECQHEARALVQLVEGELKPRAAALAFGDEAAKYFVSTPEQQKRLEVPLARLFEKIDFRPDSPIYYAALLIGAYSMITWEQYDAMQAELGEQRSERAKAAIAGQPTKGNSGWPFVRPKKETESPAASG